MLGEFITLNHGAGGEEEEKLIKELFIGGFEARRVGNGVGIDAMDDSAIIPPTHKELVITTDGHTVDPIFFPGGDLGRLAICGAVNDVAVMGAEPIAILDSIICEEGFPIADLKRLVQSMNQSAKEAGVSIIAGDFKVMPRGSLDKVIIATTGVGFLKGGRVLDSQAQPGDKVILTSSVGDHGIALLSKREGLSFETELVSDVSPLNHTIGAAMEAGTIRAMKDCTRGGLSMALNNIAESSGVSIWIEQEAIPVKQTVEAASSMLGLDPLEITCEGAAVIVVDPQDAENVLAAVKATKYGKHAALIGEIREERPGMVLLATQVGGTRILRKPLGEPIPRVC